MTGLSPGSKLEIYSLVILGIFAVTEGESVLSYLFSGGADGADQAWGVAAKKAGFTPLHFSFPGHRAFVPESELVRLDEHQLRLANKACAQAALKLDRRWPPGTAYVRKLLQRNWWQINRTPAVYAVGTIAADDSGKLLGGTAWAVQLYVDSQLSGRALRLYVFDQARERWYHYVGDDKWYIIERPPRPENDFTGIGSRKLTAAGQGAINDLFR